MKSHGKKILVLALALFFVFSMTSSGLIFATTESELQGELENVESEKDAVGAEMKKVQKEIDGIEDKVKNLNLEITAAKKKIKEVSEDITKKEAEIAKQEEELGQRLRAMYKRGSVGFFDILLGSGSINELLTNTEMIQRLYKSDVSAMEALEEENRKLKEKKSELEEEKESLNTQIEEANSEQEKLKSLYGKLEEKEAELIKESDRISEEIQELIDKQSQYTGGVFMWPVPSSQYITSYYGYRIHPVYGGGSYHSGLDIGASYGSAIVAAAGGKVISSGYNYYGYGNMVIIDHGGGITSLYGHASSLLVSVGETVSAGQTIALIGSTGLSTGPHLHFEVREGDSRVDPLNYLS